MSTSDGKVQITIDENARQAAQDFNALDQSLKNVDKSSQSVSSGSNKMLMAMSTLKGAVVAAGVAFAGMKLAQFGQQIFQVSSQFEQLNVAFGVLAGQQDGQQLVKDLTDLANVTPMTTQGLADNARMLLAMGESVDNILPDLRMLGDISGGNTEKMRSLTLAFGQIGSAGRLTGDNLRQLREQGFNPLNSIANRTGETMAEVQKRMEKGGISFSEFKQTMVEATSEGGRFYGMMQKQSETLEGKLSTLSDKWDLVGKTIGDKFLPMAKSAVNAMIRLADSTQNAINWLESERSTLANLSMSWDKYWASKRKSEATLVFTADPWIKQQRALENNTNSAKKLVKAQSNIKSGFQDSGAAENAAKTKKVATEYDKLTQKINILQDKLRMMSIRGQESSQAFISGKNQLAQYTAQIEKANKAIEITAQVNPFEKLQQDLQKATLEMQNLASTDVVDINKFNIAKQKAIELAIQLEKVNEMTKIDTTTLGSYDALNQKINTLKTNLQNMAVSGQVGTPAFEEMKNQYVEALNQMEIANKQIANASGLDWENIGRSIASNLSYALTTPLQQGESAFQRLGNVAMNIISMIGQKLIEELFVKSAVKGILNLFTGGTGGTILSALGFANGGVFKNGNVKAFANGGVVSSPTIFPMTNGTGLMGEAGAEAIMPLRRASNGRLGVEATSTQANVNIYNQSQSAIETVRRPNGETDIFIRKVNNALANERTQNGFVAASNRQSSRGITAA